jgi:neutral ceramidase
MTPTYTHAHARPTFGLVRCSQLTLCDFQVEALTGAPCLTLQGYCGDLNPRQHRAGYVVADKLGQDLGTLLVASIQTAKIVSATPVRSAEATVKLSVAPPLSAEEASSFKQQQEAWLAEVKRNGGDLRAPTCCMHYAERLCDGPPVDAIDFRVHTIRIGDIAIVGAEGELFCQYQHTLERMSPAPFTLACGYAQGCIGYVPSASEFHRGGYVIRTRGFQARLPRCSRLISE